MQQQISEEKKNLMQNNQSRLINSNLKGCLLFNTQVDITLWPMNKAAVRFDVSSVQPSSRSTQLTPRAVI